MYDQAYLPVRLYNEAVEYSPELQNLFCVYGLCMISVTFL